MLRTIYEQVPLLFLKYNFYKLRDEATFTLTDEATLSCFSICGKQNKRKE